MRQFSISAIRHVSLILSATVLVAIGGAPAIARSPAELLKLQDEAVQRAKEYLRINTANPPGNEAASMKWFARILQQEGIPPTAEPVSFQNGNVRLSGTLYRPTDPGRHPGVVVFHSANGGTRDCHAYRHLATALPAAGFAVLLFDRRGSGESTGDFRTATFQDLAADGIAGLALLKSRPDIRPTRLGVWGMSQGAGWRRSRRRCQAMSPSSSRCPDPA